MQLFSHTPARHYFIAIFVICSTLFATFSTVLYRQYNEVQELNDWTSYNYEILRQTRLILLDVVNMETGVRGYLLTEKPSYLQPYIGAILELKNERTDLEELTRNDPVVTEKLKPIFNEVESFEIGLDLAVQQFKKKGGTGLTQTTIDGQKQAMDRVRSNINGFISDRLQVLQKRISESKVSQKDFVYTLAVGTLLAIGGMFLATTVILTLLQKTRRSEEAVRTNEERFLTVMNGINDGLYDFNMQTGGVYYSPAYKKMLGYSDAEHPHTMDIYKSLLHPDDRQQVIEGLLQYQSHEMPVYTHVFRMKHKDGSWRWILSRGVGMWDSRGRMTRLIGTHTDVTEQKNREEELTQLNSDMESFTYIASHDLRAPLVNLKGFSREMQHAVERVKPIIAQMVPSLQKDEQAAMSQVFDEDLPESLRFIEQSVEKMDSLTTAVLDLSRIGKRDYRSEPVDMQALVKRTLDTLGYEISRKNIQTHCENLPEIITDQLALEQIFSNLLDNAVKYLDPKRQGKITITAHEANSEVTFCVEDNGRGIAMADNNKIFQIFRRARNTGDVRGMGMGMAYVQATVRKLGGTIWFESTEGVGTKFYVRLPQYQEKGKAA